MFISQVSLEPTCLSPFSSPPSSSNLLDSVSLNPSICTGSSPSLQCSPHKSSYMTKLTMSFSLLEIIQCLVRAPDWNQRIFFYLEIFSIDSIIYFQNSRLQEEKKMSSRIWWPFEWMADCNLRTLFSSFCKGQSGRFSQNTDSISGHQLI